MCVCVRVCVCVCVCACIEVYAFFPVATEGKFDDIRKVKDQLESSSKTLDDSFHDLVKKLTEHGLEPEAMKQQDRQDETEMSLN